MTKKKTLDKTPQDNGSTETVVLAKLIQPLASVTTTMYVVVAEGVAIGFEINELLTAEAGDHKAEIGQGLQSERGRASTRHRQRGEPHPQ